MHVRVHARAAKLDGFSGSKLFDLGVAQAKSVLVGVAFDLVAPGAQRERFLLDALGMSVISRNLENEVLVAANAGLATAAERGDREKRWDPAELHAPILTQSRQISMRSTVSACIAHSNFLRDTSE